MGTLELRQAGGDLAAQQQDDTPGRRRELPLDGHGERQPDGQPSQLLRPAARLPGRARRHDRPSVARRAQRLRTERAQWKAPPRTLQLGRPHPGEHGPLCPRPSAFSQGEHAARGDPILDAGRPGRRHRPLVAPHRSQPRRPPPARRLGSPSPLARAKRGCPLSEVARGLDRPGLVAGQHRLLRARANSRARSPALARLDCPASPR